MNNDKNWLKITTLLFPKEKVSSSDDFVNKVMSKIEALETKPRIFRIPAQWFAPVIGVAAMLCLAVLPPTEVVSAETILGGDSVGASHDVMFSLLGEDEV